MIQIDAGIIASLYSLTVVPNGYSPRNPLCQLTGASRAPGSARRSLGYRREPRVQGIVTGVGFLGAGVIVRSEKGHRVHGLTTAACVWVTACVGAACAIAQWQIVVIGVVLVLILLVFGGPFERAIDRRWPGRPSGPSDQPPDRTRAPGPEM
jgi:hypothetical protein